MSASATCREGARMVSFVHVQRQPSEKGEARTKSKRAGRIGERPAKGRKKRRIESESAKRNSADKQVVVRRQEADPSCGCTTVQPAFYFSFFSFFFDFRFSFDIPSSSAYRLTSYRVHTVFTHNWIVVVVRVDVGSDSAVVVDNVRHRAGRRRQGHGESGGRIVGGRRRKTWVAGLGGRSEKREARSKKQEAR
jgi:hypothetical protein